MLKNQAISVETFILQTPVFVLKTLTLSFLVKDYAKYANKVMV